MGGVSLAAVATDWMDQWFDPGVGLLWNPPGSFDADGIAARSVHLVQQGGWYAAGLLMRGDGARAAAVVEALCALQYDEPGTAWHGTFRRFYETPHPPPDARVWVDYDPNWRQFVATSFALLLRRFPGRLPEERMRRAIELSVEGEPDGRVAPSYSNIALMKAWLDVAAGHVDRGERFAAHVVERFRRHGAFDEYNSPTYYGVALYALALWRSESESARLRAWGAELEAALWRDVARWWHAGLGNLAGPYTRSYGMDMGRYASQLALWVWQGAGRNRAPFPDISRPFDHSHDFCFGPMVELLGARIPEAAAPEFEEFSGERTVETVISSEPSRTATAWLADGVMVGAESSAVDWRGWSQHVPATVHWRAADGTVAWLRVRHRGVVDARAEPGRLVVDCRADAPVELVSSGPLPFETPLAGPVQVSIHVDERGPTAIEPTLRQ